jgi:hypothetical protein
LDGKTPLEDQYPMTTTKLFWTVGATGAFLAANYAPLLHHPKPYRSPRMRRGKGKNDFQRIPIHHFKWQGNVITRLSNRVERIQRMKPNRVAWWRMNRKNVNLIEANGGKMPAGYLTHIGRVVDPLRGIQPVEVPGW